MTAQTGKPRKAPDLPPLRMSALRVIEDQLAADARARAAKIISEDRPLLGRAELDVYEQGARDGIKALRSYLHLHKLINLDLLT